MGNRITITLPWPPRALWPNSRIDRRSSTSTRQAFKEAGFYAAKEAKAKPAEHLAITFCPPTAGRRDLDNMLSAIKCGLDGIAAAVGQDDSEWSLSLDRGELTLLGGRPSMGKTAVALSLGLNVAREGHGVVICSLEMSPEAMAMRAISEGTAQLGKGVHYSDMRKGQMTPLQGEAMRQAAQEVAELPITFLPREFSDVGALMSGAKQAQRILGEGNMRLFIVDYAQLLQAKASSRFEEITKISIALKSLSAQLNVPVIALSQLSRKVEERQDKRPQLADLRESGQLEQDADAVMFCYRDEYYVERMKPENVDDLEKWQAAMEASRNRLEIIVAKQRQGQIGTAHVFCNPALNRIWEA